MVAANHTLAWLAHRAGTHKLDSHPRPYSTRALELTDRGASFSAAFGRREIRGYVGFVDLIGFSSRVKGSTGQQISEYLKPFLTGVLDAAMQCGGLVDKTIGDEVMICLPNDEADGGAPGVGEMRYFLYLLHDLQRRLGPDYAFCIGASYESQYVDRILAGEYREYTLVGESVILAKRLHSLPGAEPVDGFGGAFGALINEVTSEEFESILRVIAGDGQPMRYRIVDEKDFSSLRGISRSRGAILTPKVPQCEWRPGTQYDE